MHGYLPNKELLVYLVFYVILLILIFYNVLIISNSSLPDYDYLGKGWSFLNRNIDDYDVEWATWKSFIRNYWYCFGFHIIGSEVYKFLGLKNISLLYCALGFIFCTLIYNFNFLLLLVFQNLTFYFISKISKSKIHVWIVAGVWLTALNFLKYDNNYQIAENIFKIKSSKVQDFLVIFAWNLMRSTSFSLEKVEANGKGAGNDSKFNIINCFGYVFYFPTFLCGPIVIYSRYMEMLSSQKQESFTEIKLKLKTLFLNLLRFSFWFFFTEFALHYFYINSIALNKNLQELNTFCLFGLGFLMGQFFNNKYIIHYGVPISFGNFDGIPMPKKPICICRVNKYSNMWKWFDHGLYEFLFKYIYASICNKDSKIALKTTAGVTTFFFIYIWHGFFDFVLIWSIMNCLCIVFEKILNHLLKTRTYLSTAKTILKTENNIHRMNAFLQAHVLIPAVMSNFFFFGGMDVGKEFIRRTYFNGFWNYIKLVLCITCLYPVSEAIEIREQQKLQKNKIVT
ncbi:unnamed protein product [Diamesa hyperborea]